MLTPAALIWPSYVTAAKPGTCPEGLFIGSHTAPERGVHPPASSVRSDRLSWVCRSFLVSPPLTDRIQIIRSPPAVAVGSVLLCSLGLPIIRDCCRLAGPLIEPRQHRLLRFTSPNCHLGYHKDERLSQRHAVCSSNLSGPSLANAWPKQRGEAP